MHHHGAWEGAAAIEGDESGRWCGGGLFAEVTTDLPCCCCAEVQAATLLSVMIDAARMARSSRLCLFWSRRITPTDHWASAAHIAVIVLEAHLSFSTAHYRDGRPQLAFGIV